MHFADYMAVFTVQGYADYIAWECSQRCKSKDNEEDRDLGFYLARCYRIVVNSNVEID